MLAGCFKVFHSQPRPPCQPGRLPQPLGGKGTPGSQEVSTESSEPPGDPLVFRTPYSLGAGALFCLF